MWLISGIEQTIIPLELIYDIQALGKGVSSGKQGCSRKAGTSLYTLLCSVRGCSMAASGFERWTASRDIHGSDPHQDRNLIQDCYPTCSSGQLSFY